MYTFVTEATNQFNIKYILCVKSTDNTCLLLVFFEFFLIKTMSGPLRAFHVRAARRSDPDCPNYERGVSDRFTGSIQYCSTKMIKCVVDNKETGPV